MISIKLNKKEVKILNLNIKQGCLIKDNNLYGLKEAALIVLPINYTGSPVSIHFESKLEIAKDNYIDIDEKNKIVKINEKEVTSNWGEEVNFPEVDYLFNSIEKNKNRRKRTSNKLVAIDFRLLRYVTSIIGNEIVVEIGDRLDPIFIYKNTSASAAYAYTTPFNPKVHRQCLLMPMRQ